MTISGIDIEQYCQIGTKRISSFSKSFGKSTIAGVGWDNNVYVWDIEKRLLVNSIPTNNKNNGASITFSEKLNAMFIGTYYAWGISSIDLFSGKENWHRKDLKHFYGICCDNNRNMISAWFSDRGGLEIDALDGKTICSKRNFHGKYANRFNESSIECFDNYIFQNNGQTIHEWPRETFVELGIAFSPIHCTIFESGGSCRAFGLNTGELVWRYRPRNGVHIIEMDYYDEIDEYVAVEYAYTEEGRESGAMVDLVHIKNGIITYRKQISDWSTLVFCGYGKYLVNGLGELFETKYGSLVFNMEFPK